MKMTFSNITVGSPFTPEMERANACLSRAAAASIGSAAPLGLRERVLIVETSDQASGQVLRSYHGFRPHEGLQEIFRLRYEVYCVERGFIPPDTVPSGLETDEYDNRATHFGSFDATGQLNGAVRLVHPSFTQPYPFKLFCETYPGFLAPPREQCREISRLVVRRSHRRRRADSLAGLPGNPGSADVEVAGARRASGEERRATDSPMLLLGLYREMYRHSAAEGVCYWFAAMERSLARALTKMGMPFEQIGPAAEYYGLVAPYVLDLNALAAAMAIENPALATWFNEPALPRR